MKAVHGETRQREAEGGRGRKREEEGERAGAFPTTGARLPRENRSEEKLIGA